VTINQATSQNDPINTGPIIFDVFFSEVVTASIIRRMWTSAPAQSGDRWSPRSAATATTYSVSVSGMSGSGTVVASIPAGAAQNASMVGNSLQHQQRQQRGLRFHRPTVTINPAPGQPDPDNTAPINSA